MTLDLRTLARALDGEVSGFQVLAPGPGHSRRDRSLSIRLSAQAPDGFVVHSYAGDDFAACRDHVADRIGLGRGRRERSPVQAAPRLVPGRRDDEARMARAVEIWQEGRDPIGTLVERYLASRGLVLPEQVSEVIRFHPRCPWGDKASGQTIFIPAMVAAMRSIATDRITAVHRTRLNDRAEKVDRMMLGPARGSAVKLDPDEEVTTSLAIGEGIETCLAARQLGLRPTWAATSTANLKGLPVLPGIEVLTLLVEWDEASVQAVEECGNRWFDAGRQIDTVTPNFGNDMNDALLKAPT